MLVRELVTRFGFQVDENKLKGYERNIGNIKTQADSAANAFRGMFAAFIGFQGLKSLANTADEMQSIEARIKSLPQTIGDAGDAFNEVASRASNAKQGISEYAAFYIKAANATQDFISNQKDVLNIVDGVAFGLAASGASASSQSQAFFQLGQAIGSPAVQMEEMNTLIDVAPDLFRALGKAIPGANGNLKKFISTGNVTGKMLAEGLVKVMPQFEKQMRDMPMTIGTASVLMSNRWARFVANLNRESGAVTSISNFLLKGFDFIENGLTKITDFFGGATQAIKFFGIALAAIALPVAFKMLVGFVATILSTIGLLIAGLVLVGLAIEDIYQWATGGKSVAGALFGDFETVTKPVFDIFNEILGYITRTGEVISKLVDFDLIAGGIVALFKSIIQVIKGFINVIIGVFKFFFGVLTGDFKLAADGINAIFSGLITVIKGLFNSIINLVSLTAATIWSAIKVMFKLIANLAESIISLIVGAFNSIVEYFSSIFGKSLLAAIAVIIKAWDALSSTLKTSFDWIKSLAESAWKSVSDSFSSMVNKLKGYWNDFKSLFGLGAETTITANNNVISAGKGVISIPPKVSTSKLANAATSSGGVSGSSINQTITVNQTLPAGTPAETAKAAKEGIMKARVWDSPMDLMARQAGQAQ